HRGAEAEAEGRQQRARPMPAAIAEPQDEGSCADEDAGKHRCIDSAQRWRAIHGGQRQEYWREDHRLRISNLRVAAEYVGVPEWTVAGGKALGEILNLRHERGLGVPRNGG